MGFRETLAKNSTAVKAAAVILVAICVALVAMELRSLHPAIPAGAGKVFYSDDDGKTWFLGDPTKGSPFDHDGKQAYRALIYRCGASGKPFLAYLAKPSDKQKAYLDSQAAPGVPSIGANTPMQDVREPGEVNWTTNSGTMSGYPDVKCPDGSAAALVLPTDPDSGASN